MSGYKITHKHKKDGGDVIVLVCLSVLLSVCRFHLRTKPSFKNASLHKTTNKEVKIICINDCDCVFASLDFVLAMTQ